MRSGEPDGQGDENGTDGSSRRCYGDPGGAGVRLLKFRPRFLFSLSATADAPADRRGDEEQPVADEAHGAVNVTCLADGVLAYHLFLGRPPEIDAVAQDFVGASLEEAATRFFGSKEFVGRILVPVAEAGAPSEWHGRMPSAALEAPLAGALGIDADGALAAKDWAEALGLLLKAPEPRAVLRRLHGDMADALLVTVDRALAGLQLRLTGAAEALNRIRAVARGLSITSTRDLEWRDEQLVATSHDPWIVGTFDPPTYPRPLLRCLSLSVKSAENRLIGVKVYFDLGEDFAESNAIIVRSETGLVDFLLAPSDVLKRVRIDPVEREGAFGLDAITLTEIIDADALGAFFESRSGDVVSAFYRRRAVMRRIERVEDAVEDPSAAIAYSRLLTSMLGGEGEGNYRDWIKSYEQPFARDYLRMAEMMASFPHKPSFSFVVPMYNTPVDLLLRCLRSMLDQNYPYFTICVADDNSPDTRGAEMVEALARLDPRVRLVRRPINGHISEASNSAIALADGDYIVLVDHDDVIPDYCLFVLAETINRHPHAKIVFSDEDKLDGEDVRCLPYFKSALNEFLLLGHNMISHLGVYETALVRRVGGFRKGYEGSQDYDLALRCIRAAGVDAVVHVPHVLYHWQMISGSTALAIGEKSYAASAATSAVEDHLRQSGLPLTALPDDTTSGLTRVLPTSVPDSLVSILIPTRDGLNLLRPCIESVRRTATGRFEIIVIDNDSQDSATIAYFHDLQREGLATVVSFPDAFNFSAINNFGVDHAAGDILCFLNNDTEAVAAGWLDRARALLSIPAIGGVGARLLYPDGVLQHMGITLGMGAHGVAGTPHGGLPGTDPGHFGKARLLAEFSAVTAACLLVRRSDYVLVGGFDPDLAIAYNDIDLCLKLRARALKIVCDPEITLIHKESRTRGYDVDGARATRLQREADIFKSRWGEQLLHDPYFSSNHSLLRSDFSLAWPPRVAMPWLDVKGGY